MRVRLLGPLQVVSGDGEPASLATKELTLLAALALTPGQVLSRDRLADAVWGEDPPASAHNALQVYVSHLRRALGRDAVASQGSGYSLALDPEQIDAERFARLSDAGARAMRDGDPERARQLLRAALALWQGAPLGSLADRDWFRPHAERLAEARTVALEHRIAADLSSGHALDLLSELEALVGEHPYREALHAARIRALYQAGRRAEAQAAYRHVRKRLVDDLGVEPGPQLQALHAAVLQDAPALQGPQTPPTYSAVVRPPLPIAHLLGREQDLEAVSELLLHGGARWVTVLGPGGVGKTSLALEAARRLGASYDDGACWVPLTGVASPEHVVLAVANALGVRSGPAPLIELVGASLRRRHLLLVVDNLEHLLPAAPELAQLLGWAPRLHVLATSRSATRLAAEHRFYLAPLRTAGRSSSPGVRASRPEPAPASDLFIERASAVRSDLRLQDPAQVAAIDEICERLDGLPLAVELAAARSGLLLPTALLARLDHRLSLLTAASSDATSRHSSLRATLDWSMALLDADGRRLISRLSVFRGGFAIDAAEAVGDHDGAMSRPILDLLEELTEASLLAVDTGHRATFDRRLRMLQTVREYARDVLASTGEEEAVFEAHAGYLASALAQRWHGLPLFPRNAAEAEWLREHDDDLTAALGWAHSRQHHELVTELSLQATTWWDPTGRAQPALHWLSLAAAHETRSGRCADLAIWRSVEAGNTGDLETCLDAAREAIDFSSQAGDHERLACARANMGFLLARQGDPEAAAFGELTLQMDIEQILDPDIRTMVRGITAWCFEVSSPTRAMALARQAAEEARQAGDLVRMVTVSNLAAMLLNADDAAGAQHWATAALDSNPRSDLIGVRPYALCVLGSAELLLGRPEAADRSLREALELATWIADPVLLAESVLAQAALAAARGQYRKAIILSAGHRAALARSGTASTGASALLHVRFLADLPRRCDPRVLAQLQARGEGLGSGDLATLALQLQQDEVEDVYGRAEPAPQRYAQERDA